MVSRLIFVIALVAVGVATVGITQREQIGSMVEEATKPSATECEFSGQRLSEDYYCTYRYLGSGEGYLDVEKIGEKSQVPICSSVRTEGTMIDANGIGSLTLIKASGCIDTLESITVGGNRIFPNHELKVGETRVPISFDLGTNIPEGSAVTVNAQMKGRSSSVTSVTVSPAGTLSTVNPSNNNQPSTFEVTGGKEISPFQRIFVRELFNSDGTLPAYTGIHTSFAKRVSIAVEADSLVIATIEGTDCIIEGVSFDRLCEVPSNSDVILRVEGIGQAHVIVRLHYIL